MIAQHALSFRINFIIGAILNVLSMATLWLWYHPPAGVRIEGKSTMQRVIALDWTGMFLLSIGIVLFLVGIAFGGAKYPWVSAGTMTPIMIGALCLFTFGIWEWKIAKHPFFAHELFVGKGRTFPLFLIITFVGGMSLYAAA